MLLGTPHYSVKWTPYKYLCDNIFIMATVCGESLLMYIRFISALQNVTLTSTLTDGLVAYGEQEIVFTCTTRGSSILQWSSNEYISRDGNNIQVYNGTLGSDVQRGSAHATLVRASFESGVLVLVSELRIRVSTLHPTATVECNNNGHGSSRTITFNSIGTTFLPGIHNNIHTCVNIYLTKESNNIKIGYLNS